jgi:GNAT superfamily N-acetyltransferase
VKPCEATSFVAFAYNAQPAFNEHWRFKMLSIRSATIEDAPLLTTLIHEFAEYDRLSEEASVTQEDIIRDGFGTSPKFRAAIAEWNGKVAGYAVFFEFYSSFQGHAGLFLDDIFVREEFRKHGVGKSLLAHVAGVAWKEGYFCMRCEVLDWNTPAIEFYSKLGAVFLDEWKSAVLIGDALQAVAEGAK